MAIDISEVGPAVGRMLGTVFDALQAWQRRDWAWSRADRESTFGHPSVEELPAELPLVSNIVLRNESEETVVWFALSDQRYTFKREYLIDGVSLALLPDAVASVRELIASPGDRDLTARLKLLDGRERVLFAGLDRRTHEGLGTNPSEVEAIAPGRWVEGFLQVSEALGGWARW